MSSTYITPLINTLKEICHNNERDEATLCTHAQKYQAFHILQS